MRKRKGIILNITTLTISLVIYNLIELILNIFNMSFMHTVFYPFIAMVAVLSFLIICQIIKYLYDITKNIKFKSSIRIISGIGTAAISLLLGSLLLLSPVIFAFWHQPEHVVEKDGKKMVAYVNSFLQITVYYYDYINPLVRGKQLKIMVDGGNGGHDPYANGGKGPYVHRYEYYDDNGNIIDTNWPGE